tara:strand:+ start:117 stop:383 length:267 start_codon:yes stop_codon:yes gene_type:complete
MATKIITVSELKTTLAAVMGRLEAQGLPVYVTQHGKPKAVLVSYPEYEALLEKLDDLEDLVAMKEAMESPEDEAMSLEEYERTSQAQG